MRVRCERFLSTLGNRDGEETESGPGGLTRGHEYLVLSIVVDPNPPRGIMSACMLLLDDDREAQWVPTAMLSVVSGDIASSWKSRTTSRGELELAPSAWLREGFWGEYHGQETELVMRAHETFHQELAQMEAENRL